MAKVTALQRHPTFIGRAKAALPPVGTAKHVAGRRTDTRMRGDLGCLRQSQATLSSGWAKLISDQGTRAANSKLEDKKALPMSVFVGCVQC